MIATYIIITFLFIWLTFYKFRSVLRLNVIFTIMWCGGGIFLCLNPLNFYDISEDIYFYILTTIVCFNIVYIALSKKGINLKNKLLKYEKNQTNKRLIIILHIIIYIFILPILFKAIGIISVNGLTTLRDLAYTSSEVYLTSLDVKIFAWVINPIITATVIIAIVNIVLEKREKWLSFLAVIDVIAITIALGGRFHIVKAIFYLLFGLITIKKIKKKNLKMDNKQKFITTSGIFLLIYLTTQRSLGKLNFIGNLFVYFFGSFKYLDVIIHSPNYASIHNEYLYGSGIFGFLFNPFIYLLSLLSIIPNYTSEFAVNIVTDNFEYISSSLKYNAMPSMLYVFWREGRILGIVLGTIIFCLIVIFIENSFFKKPTIRRFSFYLYIAFLVFNSTLDYGLLNIQSSLCIIAIFILTSTSIKKKVTT